MYRSIVTIQLQQQRLERLKNEISENIKLGYETMDSCFLPDCIKSIRIKRAISELTGLHIIVDSFSSETDSEPKQILSIIESCIKDFGHGYEIIQEKRCF